MRHLTDEQNRLIGGCNGMPPRITSAIHHQQCAAVARECAQLTVNGQYVPRHSTPQEYADGMLKAADAHDLAAEIINESASMPVA